MTVRSLPWLLADIAHCVLFFTRLPLTAVDLAGRSLSKAIWAAPVAGWLVAVVAGAGFWLATFLGLGPAPAAALALAAGALATGGLHEDGLTDTADGSGAGADRARRLEIMRDSRIGGYGALALILSVLLRWSALSALVDPAAALAALLAAHGASRALFAPAMHLLPPARADGLSAGAGVVDPLVAAGALALGLLSLLTLGVGGSVFAAALLAALFAAFVRHTRSSVGGHTGDMLGALQQAAEILVLLVAAVALAP
jgi:adenosylcobinamide-GDP ribazoletransferase